MIIVCFSGQSNRDKKLVYEWPGTRPLMSKTTDLRSCMPSTNRWTMNPLYTRRSPGMWTKVCILYSHRWCASPS